MDSGIDRFLKTTSQFFSGAPRRNADKSWKIEYFSVEIWLVDTCSQLWLHSILRWFHYILCYYLAPNHKFVSQMNEKIVKQEKSGSWGWSHFCLDQKKNPKTVLTFYHECSKLYIFLVLKCRFSPCKILNWLLRSASWVSCLT